MPVIARALVTILLNSAVVVALAVTGDIAWLVIRARRGRRALPAVPATVRQRTATRPWAAAPASPRPPGRSRPRCCKGRDRPVLDIKLVSHMWARVLPSAACADTPETTHEALMWLAWELDRRNQVARASADAEGNVRARVGPWLLIVCKELNMTTNGLRA